MSDRHQPDPRTPPDDLAALGAWLDEQIQTLAAHPDPAVGERVSALLDGVDALHRAALGRLAALLRGPGGALLWSRARQDPVIGAVLLLYDLAEPGEGQEAPTPPAGEPPAPPAGKRALPVLPVGASPAATAPRWHDAADFGEVPPGTLRGLRVEGTAILLCNLAGEVFAYEDACPDTPLTLSSGELDGDELVCPWHGCRFEARSGRRVVHRGTGLRPFPVALAGETIRVALDAPGTAGDGRPGLALAGYP